MDLGINGFHGFTSPCKTHIITVAQLQDKHSKPWSEVNAKCGIAISAIALNRLAALFVLTVTDGVRVKKVTLHSRVGAEGLQLGGCANVQAQDSFEDGGECSMQQTVSLIKVLVQCYPVVAFSESLFNTIATVLGPQTGAHLEYGASPR
eukprot:528767-Pelagomonas_calceolata.AAC.2